MRITLLAGLIAVVILAGGCAGLRGNSQPFRSVDLNKNLTEDALRRYEYESAAAHAMGQHEDMVRLEHSNWWLPGLIVYWRRGSVMRTIAGDGNPNYDIASARGFGPLSVLYAGETHVTYNASGEKLKQMRVGSALWGHLVMFHENQVLLPDGTWRMARSTHLLHHLVSIHRMDGHTSFSLFSMPNPLSIEAHGHGSESGSHTLHH